MMKKVLLVEDEAGVVSFVKKGLTEEGYEVSVALDGNTAIQMAAASQFDIIILDIMLPGINGLEVCKTIRQYNKKIAILFLTALGTTENILMGFDSEADDYMTKPFKFVELLARIKSLIRRSDNITEKETPKEDIYQFSEITLDDYTKTVKRKDQVINLTSTEYRLMLLLLKNPKRVLSRMEILEKVWGINFDMGTNVVDVYINYLRKKIDKDKASRLIHTVTGMGYVLKLPNENSN